MILIDNIFYLLYRVCKNLAKRKLMSEPIKERLIYIDFLLYFFGDLSRSDLVERFGISEPAATRDLAAYKEQASENMNYDNIKRIYRKSTNFKPLFSHNGIDALNAISKNYNKPFNDTRSKRIRCETLVDIDVPEVEIVSKITEAIYQKNVLKIEYCSHSTGITSREIIPFALVDNGLRWHARAYDRRRNIFNDFVISRISKADLNGDNILLHEKWESDIQWNRIVQLVLVPHPNLPNPATCTFEYKMTGGKMLINIRAALAGYFLRRLNVDCSLNHSLIGREYQLWLQNRESLYGVEALEIAPGYL